MTIEKRSSHFMNFLFELNFINLFQGKMVLRVSRFLYEEYLRIKQKPGIAISKARLFEIFSSIATPLDAG